MVHPAMYPDQIQKLQKIFRIVFELAAETDVTQVSKMSQENWDSLRHMTLVAAIESEFKVNIDTADALRIDSYPTTRQLLEERGG